MLDETVELAVTDSGVILNLSDNAKVVAFYDVKARAVHLMTVVEAVSVCSLSQALRVVAVYCAQKYQTFKPCDELPLGVTIH